MKQYERYKFELLPICQSIHSSVCGSSDPLDPSILDEYIKFLEMRIENWSKSFKDSHRFDNLVKELCLAAINEGKIYQENNKMENKIIYDQRNSFF